jgi:cyclase
MKRGVVLGLLLAVGSLSLTVAGFQGPPAGPTPAGLAATTIEKVKDNLYVITGSGVADPAAFSGGNTAVFITETGVVIVDTKLPGWGQTILDRIKTVTNKPITTIINTHTHGDHTGSNAFFGTNVEAIVHENTRTNMARMPDFSAENARFLPRRTYKDKLTIGRGKDQIVLQYFGTGHTNGDTFVVFPAIRTIHTGDMFAWKALPYIDVENGGSALNHGQTLGKAVSSIKDVDTVITGHTPVLKWNELKEYADFSQDFAAFARRAFKAGKTLDQAAAEYKVPARFTGYVATVNEEFASARVNLQIAYDELKK